MHSNYQISELLILLHYVEDVGDVGVDGFLRVVRVRVLLILAWTCQFATVLRRTALTVVVDSPSSSWYLLIKHIVEYGRLRPQSVDLNLSIYQYVLDNLHFILYLCAVLLMQLFEFWNFSQLFDDLAQAIHVFHFVEQVGPLGYSQVIVVLDVLIVQRFGQLPIYGCQRWHELKKCLDAYTCMLLHLQLLEAFN